MRRAEVLWYWIPAIAWAAVLLLASGNGASSNVTGHFLAYVISPLAAAFEPVHVLLRKTGHVVAYAILGALNFRAVRGRRCGWRLGWSATAVVLAIVVASLDEYHQSFFASRTGVPSDVVIDACGATLAQILIKALAPRNGESAARREAASQG